MMEGLEGGFNGGDVCLHHRDGCFLVDFFTLK